MRIPQAPISRPGGSLSASSASPGAGAGCRRRSSALGSVRRGLTAWWAVVLGAVAAGHRDVELGVAPHAVLRHVEPAASTSGSVRIPNVTFISQRIDERGAERERADGDQPERLDAELVEPAAVEQAALSRSRASRPALGTVRNPSDERAPDAGHAVRRERADRVVDPDPLHEQRAEHDDHARDEADQDRRPRRDERARRGDRDERARSRRSASSRGRAS